MALRIISRNPTKLVTVYKAHVDTVEWAMAVLLKAGLHPQQLDEPVLISHRQHERMSLIRIAVPRAEAKAARRAMAEVETEAAPRVDALDRRVMRILGGGAAIGALAALFGMAAAQDLGGAAAGAFGGFIGGVLFIGILDRLRSAEEEKKPASDGRKRRKKRRR